MKRSQIRLALWAALPLVLIPAIGWSAPKVPPGATPREIEMGRKAAEEFEKSPKIKLMQPDKDEASKALHEKLNKMARELGAVSTRPKIDYRVKVVENEDFNAFTLPDGHIYMYRGLIQAAGSDDELAAVMAHEIGHNALMHVVRGESKAKKLSWVGLAAMAAALASGGKSGGNVAAFSQYALAGMMSAYGVGFEKEADSAAVEMMAKTNYNPSAIVTLMDRMAREEKRRPELEPGIFRTHPPSPERAEAARKALTARKIEFNPRDVEGGAQAKIEETADRVRVSFNGIVLLEVAPGEVDGLQGKERAERFATRINELMRDNLKMHEIALQDGEKDAQLLARGTILVRVTPQDARLQNLSPVECAQKWRAAFGRLFWRETINGKM